MGTLIMRMHGGMVSIEGLLVLLRHGILRRTPKGLIRKHGPTAEGISRAREGDLILITHSDALGPEQSGLIGLARAGSDCLRSGVDVTDPPLDELSATGIVVRNIEVIPPFRRCSHAKLAELLAPHAILKGPGWRYSEIDHEEEVRTLL